MVDLELSVKNMSRKRFAQAISLVGQRLPENGNADSDFTNRAVAIRAREWADILLFMELYQFVLMIMDDEEFLSGSLLVNQSQSWTGQSALPLDQVAELVKFLKHLAFSLYWYGPEIMGLQKEEPRDGLSRYFGVKNHSRPSTQGATSEKHKDVSLAGIPGMTLIHLKGMVTGLLRMIYEREYVISQSVCFITTLRQAHKAMFSLIYLRVCTQNHSLEPSVAPRDEGSTVYSFMLQMFIALLG